MTGAGSGADFVLRLASTLILARLLVPEQFGLVAMVTAVARLAERFATLGLSTATVQAPEITHEQCSNLFWFNVGAGVLFALALVALSPALATFYDDSRLQAIAVTISLSFVWTGLGVQHEALLRRTMRLPQVAGNQLFATFCSVCLAVGLALGGFGYWALVWKEVSRTFFIAVGAWTLCRWVPGLPKRRANMRRLLLFGRDMTLTQMLLSVSAQLDSLLIGKFAGATELGLYRQADNLMKAPVDRLNAPIATVSQSGLSILQREPARYRRYYDRILSAVSLITVPLGIFTIIYAEEIVLVALGEKWSGTTIFLQIFALLASIRPALSTTAVVMITCGRSGRFFVISLAHSVVLIGLMIVGIGFGAVGVATAHLLTAVLLMPWLLYYAFDGTPVSTRLFWRSVAKPAVAACTMAVIVLTVRELVPVEKPALALALGCAIAIPAYFLALCLLPGGRKELENLIQELISAVRKPARSGPARKREVES